MIAGTRVCVPMKHNEFNYLHDPAMDGAVEVVCLEHGRLQDAV